MPLIWSVSASPFREFSLTQMRVAGQVDLDVDQPGCSRQSDGFSGICVPERILLLLRCP